MSYEAIGTLIDRWLSDPVFRAALRADPRETVRKTGIALDQEEWEALQRIDWNASDEELKRRASKLLA